MSDDDWDGHHSTSDDFLDYNGRGFDRPVELTFDYDREPVGDWFDDVDEDGA